MKPSPLVQNLLARRVPQIMAAYFGFGLALIPFVGFLVDTYELPRALLNAVLVAYISLVPSVFLVAYNHGAPGRDPWLLAERVGVPFNLVMALGLVLYTLFSTGEAEAKIEKVVITDEAGVEQERLVPKSQYRRKLVLFFWDNDSGDESLDWLRYGFPMMLERDLEQNRFVSAATPLSGRLQTEVRRAGFDDALGVPLALAQEISEDQSVPTFALGSFGRDGDALSARLELYDAETAALLSEHVVSGADPAALVDQLTDRLKGHLEVEDLEGLGRDLPVSEQLSASSEAIRAWIEGRVARWLANDSESALARFRAAVTTDPTFARGHLEIAFLHSARGEFDDARAALRRTQRHKYRLTERDQFYSRAMDAQMALDRPKAIRALETLVKLYPDDVEALGILASNYHGLNQIPKAIATYRRILDFDPNEDWALTKIGDLYAAQRDWDAALEAYRQAAQRHPEDPDVQYSIAELERTRGDLEAARRTIEGASLLAASDPIKPALMLARIDLFTGDVEAAGRRLEEAEGEASLPQELADVLKMKLYVREHSGQIERAEQLMGRLRGVEGEYLQPVWVDYLYGARMATLYGSVGQVERAEAWIEQFRQKAPSPVDRQAEILLINLYLIADDVSGMETHLEPAREVIDALTQREDLTAQLEIVRGRSLELRGDVEGAVRAYRAALDGIERSTMNLSGSDFRVFALSFHARAAVAAGELDAAADSLGEALKLAPAFPLARVQMARLARARGDLDKAREHLAVALGVWADADPEFKPAIEARELARGLRG